MPAACSPRFATGIVAGDGPVVGPGEGGVAAAPGGAEAGGGAPAPMPAGSVPSGIGYLRL